MREDDKIDFALRERRNQYGLLLGGWSCVDQDGVEHGPFLSKQQATNYAKLFCSRADFREAQRIRLGLASREPAN